jgi:hypothetical protein
MFFAHTLPYEFTFCKSANMTSLAVSLTTKKFSQNLTSISFDGVFKQIFKNSNGQLCKIFRIFLFLRLFYLWN